MHIISCHITLYYVLLYIRFAGRRKPEKRKLGVAQLLTALTSPPPTLRSNQQLHVAVAFRRLRFAAAEHRAILWAYYDYVAAFRQHSRRRAAPSPYSRSRSKHQLHVTVAIVAAVPLMLARLPARH